MFEEVEIIYPHELTCEFVHVAEFLRLCGVYVYETSMDYPEWKKKACKTGIAQKIYLLQTEEQVLDARCIQAGKKTYIICDKNKTNFYRSIKEGLPNDESFFLMDDLEQWLKSLEKDEQWNRFIMDFYPCYKDEQIYRAIFCIKNIPIGGRLLTEYEKQLEKLLGKIEEQAAKSGNSFYYFPIASLCTLVNKGKVRSGKENKYSFDYIINACNRSRSKNTIAFYELKGDAYFQLVKNYVLGLLFYEKCLNGHNCTVPLKIAMYWNIIGQNRRQEERYLRMALECNIEQCIAAVRLGRMYEDMGKLGQAKMEYVNVISTLENKTACNYLLPQEFQCLCIAHKRMGCITYKDPQHPKYQMAIQEYKKIFEVWNKCEENGFIMCFPQDLREVVADFYRDLFDIRSTIGSLSKIYAIIGEGEKNQFCLKLFRHSSLSDLKILPLEKL